MNFPIALELAGRYCLVVGSGAEARRRLEQFKACGARVRWVYSEPQSAGSGDAQAVASEAHVDEVVLGNFEPEHLAEVWLAVLTDRDDELAAVMQQHCEARRVWFCAVDQPAFNSFSHVAQLRLDPLLIAISSDGRAPLLSRRVRDGLAALFDHEPVRRFFVRLAGLREQTPTAERRAVLERALDGFRIDGKVVLPPEELDGTDTR